MRLVTAVSDDHDADLVRLALLLAALMATACAGEASAPSSPGAPSEPAASTPAPAAEVTPPAPVAEPAPDSLPMVPGVYLRHGDAWVAAVLRTRNRFTGNYDGTDGMRSADLPICDDPCRLLILDMPTIDTTALFRGAPERVIMRTVPPSQYPWRAEPDRAHPLQVAALRPGAYTVEIAASRGEGAFDLAALVAVQDDLGGRAVFFIIRRH